MITRGENSQPAELNIVGSSVFGRYPKIDSEKTINMFESDSFLVPYAGYNIALDPSNFDGAIEGRGIYTSAKLNAMFAVFDERVYKITLTFNQSTNMIQNPEITLLGTIPSSTGIVYITENNKPQVVFCDGHTIVYYDPSLGAGLLTALDQNGLSINFVPTGYICYHDTYILASASYNSSYDPPANNTWRLGTYDTRVSTAGTLIFPTTAPYTGLLQTKPDNTQAVVRVPGQGNMIFVMGKVVTEAWFDTGAQLFPYQRNNQMNIDYGCISPASVAFNDEIVAWLAQNEKSGPVIMYSKGGPPQRITTDGIDYLFSKLQNPQDSQGFIYRQDGHNFYHINFYSDNLSLFYDFNTNKFYNATDQNGNYFIADDVTFYGNQYYFVTHTTGSLYVFDSDIYTYTDTAGGSLTTQTTYTIPRSRICKNIRLPTQEYFVVNDIGFTIETGTTSPYYGEQPVPPTTPPTPTYPVVYLSCSYDGGQSFGTHWKYQLNPTGVCRNKLMWWQCGAANDFVAQFNFVSTGRVVVTNGEANIRK